MGSCPPLTRWMGMMLCSATCRDHRSRRGRPGGPRVKGTHTQEGISSDLTPTRRPNRPKNPGPNQHVVGVWFGSGPLPWRARGFLGPKKVGLTASSAAPRQGGVARAPKSGLALEGRGWGRHVESESRRRGEKYVTCPRHVPGVTRRCGF